MWLLATRVLSNISSVVTMLVFLMGTRGLPCVVREDQCVPGEPAPLDLWRIALATVVAIAVGAVIIEDLVRTIGARPRVYAADSPKIRDYLVRWIRSGGKAAIVSRNMSWVDAEVLAALTAKAQSGDLEIYMPASTEHVRDLVKHGAKLHEYGAAATRSRFTIVNAGRGDARVAIGAVVEGGKHVIREYNAGDPVLVMAQDLLDRLARP